ncbi:PepSY domain-containing protein [Chitinophaga pendula]|uniref:PepSY-associated TM helix domain-containing protein n=1 Tax=Chitinophaga TaxID=79328 RepID=UPI000BB0BF3A|nr:MULTISPECIES: PepSY-associated TM helix domain-containing protein [Chitinophaga]ASZ10188.1 peptidase M4 [Chitinophaga sp. MD30]UCJ06857.1 PepSY domain-containing protein [Chitinophaga pendula]
MQKNVRNTSSPAAKPAKKGKSRFRKVNDFLHLWLGLISGIIVFIVSVTGCIYAFEREIRNYTQPYQFVEAKQAPYLPPSQLKVIAAKAAFGSNAPDSMTSKISGVSYGAPGTAAIAAYTDKKNGYTMVYMNPYDGKVLHQKILKDDFFRFILEGHFNLWLPREIGQPIVASAVLIFVFLLISGLIMWWPKKWTKAARDQSFKVKWKASFKRVNYDLHNVLGFYVMTIALVLGLTGLVWGFKWFSKSYYWTLTGGKTMPAGKGARPSSDTLQYTAALSHIPEDVVFQNALKEYKGITGTIQVQFAVKKDDAISLTYNPDQGTYNKREFRYFDQYTLKEIPGKNLYSTKYNKASIGEKIYRSNYDIHVGAIAGLPGKILAFFASLICASLPVTGFYVWWGKKKKQKKPALQKPVPAKTTIITRGEQVVPA